MVPGSKERNQFYQSYQVLRKGDSQKVKYLFGKYAENDIDVYNIICYTSERIFVW